MAVEPFGQAKGEAIVDHGPVAAHLKVIEFAPGLLTTAAVKTLKGALGPKSNGQKRSNRRLGQYSLFEIALEKRYQTPAQNTQQREKSLTQPRVADPELRERLRSGESPRFGCR